MIKVFLVEDEIIVREGLIKKVKWDDLGVSLVGEAADGELAYPLILETKPDILITDIKMPFMDGIQLSKLIKKEIPWIKIIIISGHDDFIYAQKAIGIGVSEYILKPVNSEQISQAVLRVKADIESESEHSMNYKKFKAEMHEYEKLEHKRFFLELVSKRHTEKELFEKSRQLGLDLDAAGYNIILFQPRTEPGKEDKYVEDSVRLEREIEKRFASEPKAILFDRDLEGFALLVKGSASESVERASERFVDVIKNIFPRKGGTRFFAAVGSPVMSLTELPAAFEALRRTYVYRYIVDRVEVMYSRDGGPQMSTGNEDLSFLGIDPKKVDRRIFERYLRCGTVDDVENFVTDYFENLGNQMESMFFRQYIVMDAIFALISLVEDSDIDKAGFMENLRKRSNLAQALLTVDSTKGYLCSVIGDVLTLRENLSSKRYRDIIEDAKHFIGENYANDNISLNTVAASVNISPSHFSTIFSQETGGTFIEYLTNIRMEKAMELLRGSGMKTSEIGYRVGYHDPHYFSYLFKKRLGVTPKEFRAGRQIRT